MLRRDVLKAAGAGIAVLLLQGPAVLAHHRPGHGRGPKPTEPTEPTGSTAFDTTAFDSGAFA